jgi:serine/threonine protein kinase
MALNPFEGIFMQNGRIENEFDENDKPIGMGGYGVVFKAMNKIDRKYYAIKKIKIKGYSSFLIINSIIKTCFSCNNYFELI